MLRGLFISVLVATTGIVVLVPTASATSGDDCPGAWGSWLGGGDPPSFNTQNCSPLQGRIEECLCAVTCDDGALDTILARVGDLAENAGGVAEKVTGAIDRLQPSP